MSKVFYIPESNMYSLESKLSTIEKKCHKYGCNFSYNKIGEEFKKVTFEDKFTYISNLIIKFIVIEVEGKAIINDWEFIATIEHHENGNVIRKYNYDVEVPEVYRTCAPNCEHCHTDRPRKDTYLVRNIKTGEFRQLGKACLKDYTNGLDAELVALYESAYKICEENECCNYSGNKRYLAIIDMLKYYSECVSKFGYAKRGTEYPTLDRAEKYYDFDNDRIYNDEVYARTAKEMKSVNFNANSVENLKLVEDMLNWIRNIDDTSSEYMHNLKTICMEDYVEYRNLGFIASLPQTYKKHLEKMAESAKSEFVGEIGKDFSEEVTLKSVRAYETYYSYRGETHYIYSFLNNDNNIVIWKSDYKPEFVNGEGKRFTISGKVKEHTEYNGTKQTVLTRCKYSEI